MTRRSTIRARLTRFYGFMFLLCGAGLLVVSYVVVRNSLISREGNTQQYVIESYGYSKAQVEWFHNLPVPPPKPGTGREAKTAGDVIVSVQRDIRDEALHSLLVGSSAALAGMLLVSAAIGWMASGRALRPVGQLTARARRLSEANLHERIDLQGPTDELKELADTLDGMIARLEVAFNSQRRFAQNVSHELRTPLSIIRAEADVALSDTEASAREIKLATSVRDAADRTEALLNSLLALSRSESTMNDQVTIDLGDLAGDVVSERIDAANGAQVTLDLELGSDAPVDGDPWLLERLVANLVDNGITHNAPGGWVEVSVERRNGSGVLRVKNTGDKLTPEQVDDILQPFHRAADHRRPGFGLGMTIVQSVAKAHAGTVDITPRDEGGLDVVVELPLHRNGASS